jgi:hypothetical protein
MAPTSTGHGAWRLRRARRRPPLLPANSLVRVLPGDHRQRGYGAHLISATQAVTATRVGVGAGSPVASARPGLLPTHLVADEGVGTFSLHAGSRATVLLVRPAVAVAATLHPAWRASRADVLPLSAE